MVVITRCPCFFGISNNCIFLFNLIHFILPSSWINEARSVADLSFLKPLATYNNIYNSWRYLQLFQILIHVSSVSENSPLLMVPVYLYNIQLLKGSYKPSTLNFDMEPEATKVGTSHMNFSMVEMRNMVPFPHTFQVSS